MGLENPKSKRTTEISLKPFKLLQNNESKQRYYRFFARFIIYIIRVGDSDYPQGPRFNGIIKAIFFNLEAKLNTLSSDNFDYELINRDDKYAIFQLILRLLDQLLKQSTRQESAETLSIFNSPILTFLALESYNFRKESFNNTGLIQNLLSQFIYTIKYFSALYLYLSDEEEEKNRSKKDIFATKFDKYCEKYLKNTSSNGYSTLLLIRPYLSEINRNETDLPRVSENNSVISVNSEEIDLSKLKLLLKSEIHELGALLYSELLYITKEEARSLYKIEDLKDRLSEDRNDYSFANFELSELIYARSLLIDNYYRTPSFRLLFSDRDPQNSANYRFNTLKLTKYFKIRERFIEKLIFLVYFLSGPPIRGTELAEIRLKNTSLRTRNIYFDINSKLLLFNLDYNKMSYSGKNTSRNIRFLPREISEILIDYLVLFYPFYLFLRINTIRSFETSYFSAILALSPDRLNGRDEQYTYITDHILYNSEYLFEIKNNRPSSYKISKLLANTLEANIGANFTLSSLRHLGIYIVQHYIDPNYSDEDIEADFEKISDYLSNHSSKTANLVYARDSTTLPNQRRDYQLYAFDLCSKLHSFYLEDNPSLIR
jgi:hypothetical protein